MRSLRGRLTLGVLLVVAALLLAAGARRARTTSTAPSGRRSTTACERTAELSRATPRAAHPGPGCPPTTGAWTPCSGVRRASLRLPRTGASCSIPARRRRAARGCGHGLQTFSSGGTRYRAT